MKILFIGSVIFSKRILESLINKKFDVCGIITKKKSNFNSDFFDLSQISRKTNIDFKYAKNINKPSIEKWIKNKKPDIILCCGWSELINRKILNLAKIGCIGYHPADLPNNRGRHPIIWTILLGLKKATSTFFWMDEGADTGEVLSKKKIKILNKDSATSIYKKLNKISINQIISLLKKIKKNKIKYFNKNNKKASSTKYIGNAWRKRRFVDGEIDFRMSSKSIINLIKSLTYPYPNAHFFYKKKIYKVIDAEEIKCNIKNIEPGKILSIKKNGSFIVKTGKDSILIKKTLPVIRINSKYIL